MCIALFVVALVLVTVSMVIGTAGWWQRSIPLCVAALIIGTIALVVLHIAERRGANHDD